MQINKQALNKVITGTPDERKYLCEQDFSLFMAYYFLDYIKYPFAGFHFDMFQDLKDLMAGKYREVAWIMFRESAKTSIAKIFLVYLICYKKKRYINVDSFDKENAERILFDIVSTLQTNNRLIADFGQLYNAPREKDKATMKRVSNFVTNNEIRVEAHSTQESIRGRLHKDQRPDFFLFDDIETNKTRDSKAYTEQVIKHLEEVLAGLSVDASVLYLGNYITEYGSINLLKKRAETDHKLLYRDVPVILDGVPTWPGKYALSDSEASQTGKVSLEDKQRQLGSQVFASEMLNRPIDDSVAEFKKEWIQTATEEDLKHLNYLTFIAIDTAVSKKDSADFTGITIDRVSSEGKRYVTAYKMKINSTELIEHIFFLQEKYKPEILGIEETSYLLAIKPFMEEEMRKRNKHFTITPLKHGGIKKETRIRGLIPLMENKSVFFVGDCTALEEEMRVFPRGLHDDVLDSFQYAEQIAFKPYDEDSFDVFEEEKPLYPSIGV